MKNYIALAAILVAGLSLSSCKKDAANDAAPFGKRSAKAGLTYDQAALLPVKTISSDIAVGSYTFDKDTVYELSGVITVRDGGVLNIEAGTYIKSTPNAPNVQNGVLVVSKTGTIHASGTEDSPIVFTSKRLLDNDPSTIAAPGDFGGVIVLGNDTVNTVSGDKLIEGLADLPKFHYGGNVGNDSRGELEYVRIEYAGFQLAPNIEVNGLTLGGVGTGTKLDNIQVSYGLDDGFEFFGGSVNATHLIALASDDDQFDFDNGYNGTIRFAIAVADGSATHSVSGSNSDSNGIESDNNAPAEDNTFSRTPFTNPKLSRISIIGTNGSTSVSGLGYRNGIRERRGSRIRLDSSIITGYPRTIMFDVASTTGEAGNFSNSVITANNSFHAFTAISDVGLSGTVAASASTFSLGAPFYNVSKPNLDFFNATRGGDDGWVFLTQDGGWVKFDY